ncbi:MAG: hypothetical protein CMI53_01560 [Parcubacteria group bacterium]|nr:hypothetical protein [Parcubacteria group bacterium]|tara:strand:- start:68 stop:832 length:765 start_codon:yes stop_codon:yes gene_type:complete
MEEKKSLMEDKAFWLALACVVIILSSIWLFDYSGIVGNVVQSISYMKEDSELRVGINDVEGLFLANLQFQGVVSDATVTIEEDKNILFDGIAYSKFKLSFQNGEKLKNVTFTLKLKESKLKSLGLSKEAVRLYAGAKEIALTPAKRPNLDSSQDFVYYDAVTSQKGEFVIGKKTVVKKVEETKVAAEKTMVKKPETEKTKEVVKEPKAKPMVQKPAPMEKNIFSEFFKGLGLWVVPLIAFVLVLIFLIYSWRKK